MSSASSVGRIAIRHLRRLFLYDVTSNVKPEVLWIMFDEFAKAKKSKWLHSVLNQPQQAYGGRRHPDIQGGIGQVQRFISDALQIMFFID